MWRKGQSGNPKGRPRTSEALSDLLRSRLDRRDDGGVSHRTRIMERLIELAEGGNIEAIRVVLDRVDGRVRESVDLTHGMSDVTLNVMADIAARMRETR